MTEFASSAKLLITGAIFAMLWAIVSRNQGWWMGGAIVLAALALSFRVGLPSFRLRPQFLPGFILYFLSRQFVGGLDVARRTVSATPTKHAGWVDYPLSSATERPRVLLSAMIGLLPGTLGARITDDKLLIHTLDTTLDWQQETAQLEQRLLKLLGEDDQ
ncbi:Na+/H+ antiporter subunit E [Pseudohongiella spirulinae]|uniref:Multisubunit Na+/H+ antiporter, MnhE subunit n=1 Tax=Pseudohongiella spirulinae TaxID=1249552 RepID=A0A0S2K9N0_9GAMM|nr:Na+/H+ antiporter subunit E [Pseudohongiella spirulinae]ALO45037.1 Multisubunit Na+/H+ antiporter, MnhE subunit [Pseudohongiella spirulinae]